MVSCFSPNDSVEHNLNLHNNNNDYQIFMQDNPSVLYIISPVIQQGPELCYL